MKLILTIIFGAFSGMIMAQSTAQSTEPLKEGLNQSTIRTTTALQEKFVANAVIWLPPGYSNTKKYPLLIYGHGAGSAGTEDSQSYDNGLPAILEDGFKPPFECIIICLQKNAPPEWLPGILEDAGRRFPIDSSRVYLTGTSAGGFLCYGSQLNVSQDLATKFAAICVLSGAAQEANESNLGWWVKSRTPLWAIVGSEDQTFVRQNIYITHALNQRAPGLARISIRDGIGHGGWTEIYNGNFHDNGQNFWDWLYQFKLTPVRNPVRPPARPSPSRPAIKTDIKTPAKTPAGKIAGPRRIYLKARDGQVYCTNVMQEYNPRPGDTLVIPTGILSFLLRNFEGDRNKPLTLIPSDSGWIGGYGPYSAVISNASYFKVTGFHIDGQNKSSLGMAIASQTTDYEISRCRIQNIASIGLLAKQDPDSSFPGGSWPGFTIRNASIHDIAVSNTGTEGLYIGYTFDIIKPLASPLINLRIYNITIDSTGWDGLQLSNCQQVKLHDISIKDYGLKNEKGQQAGLLLGGMVTLQDSVYNVRVSDGTGAGLLIFGRGPMKFNKIRLSRVGMTIGENAIFVNDYKDLGYNLPPLQLFLKNISVIGSAGSALEIMNDNGSLKPGRIENFSFSDTRSGLHTPSSLFIIK